MWGDWILVQVGLLVLGPATQACRGNGPGNRRLRMRSTTPKPPTSLPVVMWHGINDDSSSMDWLVDELRQFDEDIYILNINIGDKFNSFLMTANNQVEKVCDMIGKDARLADGFNGLGYSQGGLFLRAVIQRCPKAKMKNFVTIGAPHQGIFGIPKCHGSHALLCVLLRYITTSTYSPYVQDMITPAQYWHDPVRHQDFLQGSHFLADINNERSRKNRRYKENLARLDNFVMIQWKEDTTLIPAASSQFGFYNEKMKILHLRDSQLYKEDWIGLKKLDAAGRLHFFHMRGDHNQLDYQWLSENIVKPFLITELNEY